MAKDGERHRELVMAALGQAQRPMSAYALLEALKPSGVNAPVTIYRALGRLSDEGRVHRVESLNAWVPCDASCRAGGAVLAICDACGTVQEHGDPALAAEVRELAARIGFSAAGAVIEIRGRCRGCRAGAPGTA